MKKLAFLYPALAFIAARGKEPNSYIGLSLAAAALHSVNVTALSPYVFLILQGVFGIVAYFCPEPAKAAPPESK